ncbi:XRE family transcriptional regulator [Nitratireductor sp. XY-223]|uniref:helix-turn-helix domain-containing protein n=1 Tax=Nitratireductor sp. XY-223 TaxID=2561926 RepID=UPI0010AADA3A|nr:XRE family transcriptional regulator [Nitratireductor sp. XY-223]
MASDGAQAEKYNPGNVSADIGRDIRAIRQSKGMTLTEMAVKLGRSIGYLSQVERGISALSTEELRQVAELFGVPLSWFLVLSDVSEDERGHVTRAGLRRMSGDNEGGLAEELLSPDLSGSYEVIRSVFAPGAKLSKPTLRMTEETAYMVSGTLDIRIGNRQFTVRAGDSFRFKEEEFYWENNSNEPAVAIWVVSPPIY